MMVDQLKREIYQRYPDWFEIEEYTTERLYAIWRSICKREDMAKEYNQMLKNLEKKGLYLRPSGEEFGSPYHQITIDEFLESRRANG